MAQARSRDAGDDFLALLSLSLSLPEGVLNKLKVRVFYGTSDFAEHPNATFGS